jgi:3-oxoacyl-[acyl-carrier protein] reductase
MLLEHKTAVVYGGGGTIGGAIGRAFAREGATVHLAGRTPAKLETVARDIVAAGGVAEVANVDALDERAVTEHADAVAAAAGGIDIAVNAVGIPHVHGTPFAELSFDEYALPIHGYARTCFVTAKAVSRHMVAQGSGAILTLSTPGSKLSIPGVLGFGAACAAIEAFSRMLASELGPSGVRVVCLRPDAIPEAAALGSHSGTAFEPVAAQAGVTVDEMLAGAAQATLLNRLPTLAQVADAAVFAASDWAGAMTGTVVNLSCDSLVD